MAGLLPETAAWTQGEEMPSRTWKINCEENRIDGVLDGAEALKQAAMLALLTPRFRHLIYSFDYGSELESLIGQNRDYAAAAAPSMAEEALAVDSRFSEVKSGKFSARGDSLEGSVSLKSGGGTVLVEAAIGGSNGNSNL